DRCQNNCRSSLTLAMKSNHLIHVDISQHVAVEHHGRLGYQTSGVPIGARGTQRRCLHGIADKDVVIGPIADLVFDFLRLIRKREYYIPDIGTLEQLELIKQEWLIGNWNYRLGCVHCERPESSAFSARQYECLHRNRYS